MLRQGADLLGFRIAPGRKPAELQEVRLARRLEYDPPMRLVILSIVALAVLSAAPATASAAGDFGLGLSLGRPTGLSMKYYLGASRNGSPMALQAGLGVSEGFGDDGLHVHVDVLWHPVVLARGNNFALPFYFGVGGRVLEDDDDCYRVNGNIVCYDDDDTRIGVRVPFGLLMDFARPTIDIFFELAFVVDIIELDDDNDPYDDEDDALSLDGAIGVRFYF